MPMLIHSEIISRLQTAFEPDQVAVLAEVIALSYENLVKIGDFDELKAIMRDLAVSHKETREELSGLAASHRETREELRGLAASHRETREELRELATSQKELAVSQQRTEEEVRKLVIGIGELRTEVGGISRSIGYSLENEAYRNLPAFLLEEHGIEMTERLIRTNVGDEEINFFGRAVRNGKPLLVVGESKQVLDERRRARQRAEAVIEALERKAEAARNAHPDEEILLLFITHSARPAFLEAAEAKGILVVQSFEW